MTFNQVTNPYFISLSLYYAKEYQENPKVFLSCFKKYASVRTCCENIVRAYKEVGAFDEIKADRDFVDYALKHYEGQTAIVFAEFLLIIYSLIKQ